MYNTILTWSLLHADKRHFGINNTYSRKLPKGRSIKPRKLKPINRKIRAYFRRHRCRLTKSSGPG